MCFLLYQSDKGFFTVPLSTGFLYYSSPTEDSVLFLSQGISLLFQSGNGFFTIPLSKDFFTIPLSEYFFTTPIRQRILYYSFLNAFLCYSSPTEDSLCFLSQRTSLVFQSDRGFFTVPLSKDCCIIPVRQRMISYFEKTIRQCFPPLRKPINTIFVFIVF